MRSSIPTVHCDADDCIEWEPDEEAMCTTSINGLQITAEHRALGWFSTEMNDYCPDHAAVGRVLAGRGRELMAGTITPPPPEAHRCEGRPPAGRYPRATVWTCDDCGKKFVVVVGSQYNEPYAAWRALTDRTREGFDR